MWRRAQSAADTHLLDTKPTTSTSNKVVPCLLGVYFQLSLKSVCVWGGIFMNIEGVGYVRKAREVSRDFCSVPPPYLRRLIFSLLQLTSPFGRGCRGRH